MPFSLEIRPENMSLYGINAIANQSFKIESEEEIFVSEIDKIQNLLKAYLKIETTTHNMTGREEVSKRGILNISREDLNNPIIFPVYSNTLRRLDAEIQCLIEIQNEYKVTSITSVYSR